MLHVSSAAGKVTNFRFQLVCLARILGQHHYRRVARSASSASGKARAGANQPAPGTAFAGLRNRCIGQGRAADHAATVRRCKWPAIIHKKKRPAMEPGFADCSWVILAFLTACITLSYSKYTTKPGYSQLEIGGSPTAASSRLGAPVLRLDVAWVDSAGRAGGVSAAAMPSISMCLRRRLRPSRMPER